MFTKLYHPITCTSFWGKLNEGVGCPWVGFCCVLQVIIGFTIFLKPFTSKLTACSANWPFTFVSSFFFFFVWIQAQKLCLLILGTFLNCQSRYILLKNSIYINETLCIELSWLEFAKSVSRPITFLFASFTVANQLINWSKKKKRKERRSLLIEVVFVWLYCGTLLGFWSIECQLAAAL